MTVASWPLTLPQALLIEGNQESIPDGRLRSQPDTGPPKMRPRSSAVGRPLVGSMLMTEDQVAILDAFVHDDLALGTLPFTFPVMRGTGTWLVRIGDTMPSWSDRGNDNWSVSLALEVLP